MRFAIFPLMALAFASPAKAERDFCGDRPGLDTPPCTLEAGRLQIEIGIGDWVLDRQAATRTDTIATGDLLLRFGLNDSTEAQIGWTAYGHVRERDRISGTVDRLSGIGDVTVAVRHNLKNPDGSGLSIAVQPYATLPAGNSAIGAGDWGAGLLMPVTLDLTDDIHLGLTPGIDAAVDSDRSGRHLSFGSVASVAFDISDAVGTTVELAAFRDEDPHGHSTQALAAISFAWQADENLQFDIGANAGLNRDTPDIELYFGLSRRF